MTTNRDIDMFWKHGLTGNTKRRVFEALYEMQQGKCFICGISQEEIIIKYQEMYNHFSEWLASNPEIEYYRRRVEEGPAPVHRKLHIDHCHETGMIRGLLCEKCNYKLGKIENSGLFEHYSTPAFQYTPLNTKQQELVDWLRWHCDDWLDRYRTIILLYMQQERWLPREDILFHLHIK